MKKFLSVLCCGIFFFPAKAQMPYVSTPTIIPQNPTANSFIKVITKVTTPNQGIIVDINTFTVMGQQISIRGCYWQGMATATQDFIDTLMIGQLPAGNYSVMQRAYMSSTQQHCTRIDSNAVVTSLTVSAIPASLSNQAISNESFHVYYNSSAEALVFSGVVKHPEVFIFSSSGALVKAAEADENKPLYIADLANGLYFVRSSTGEKPVKFIKE